MLRTGLSGLFYGRRFAFRLCFNIFEGIAGRRMISSPTNIKPLKILDAGQAQTLPYLQQVYRYKHLITVFAWQEIKSAYAQTYFGLAWAVLRPLLILLIFTVLFKMLLHVDTPVPYYLFAFSGMLAWNYFSQLAISGSTAVVQQQHLIRKMYFPKTVLLLVKALVAGLELAISLLILLVMITVSGIGFHGGVFLLPVFLILNAAVGFIVAVWMTALNIRFRDLNQLVPALIGIAVWFTPVFYPTTLIPDQYRFLLWFNPLAGIIKGVRFSLLGTEFPEWQFFIAPLICVALAFAGLVYLIKVEDKLVDSA